MIDFESEKERNSLVEDIQGLCAYCSGHGMVMDKNDEPTDCPNVGLHAAIANNIPHALEFTAGYESVQEDFDEAVSQRDLMSQAVGELTAQLLAVGEAAKKVGDGVDEIIDILYHAPEGAIIDQIRASVLREMAEELHYPLELVDGTCICGEKWEGANMCAEARRIVAHADQLYPECDV